MAGVFRKAMVWLGLAPDDEYDDYGYDEPIRPAPTPGRSAPGGAPGPQGAYGQQGPYGQQGAYGQQGGGAYAQPGGRSQRPAPRRSPEPDEGLVVQPRPARPSGSVRPLPSRGGAADAPERTPTVRPMRPTSAKPTVVAPASFDDAKEVADRFKAEQPVVMDLSGVDKELARRLIDFASGICYALGGNMQRVTPGVYLIVPSGVDVSDEERRRLQSGR